MVKSSVLINKNIFAQRFLGWFFINMLIAFMINNILNLAYKIPFAIELITKNELLSLSLELEIPIVATNDSYFKDKNHFEAFEMLSLIEKSKTISTKLSIKPW